ncbi:hypothetical protein DMENIID0001_117820 [Sergentomyia squamirostris]
MAYITVSGAHYKVNQVNGQRLVGPPDMLRDLQPPENCEVFLSNIPPHVTECEILPVVSRFGTVLQLRLMMKINGENRGFCYVMYTREDLARNAIRNLNNSILWGNKLRVSLSRNTKELILGAIHPSVPDSVILQTIFTSIQPTDVQTFIKFNTKYAILEFPNHREAALAKRAFSVQIKQFGKDVFLKWYK